MDLSLSKIKKVLFPKPKIKAIIFDYGGVIETRDLDLYLLPHRNFLWNNV